MSPDLWVEHLETGERFRVRKVHSHHGSGTLEVLVHQQPYPLRAGRHRLHMEGRKWQIVIPCASLRNEFYHGPEDTASPPPAPATRRLGRHRELAEFDKATKPVMATRSQQGPGPAGSPPG